jgi:hypothetical protein
VSGLRKIGIPEDAEPSFRSGRGVANIPGAILEG